MSSRPGDPVPGVHFAYKAVVYHLFVFFLLASFSMIAMSRGKNKDFIYFAVLFSFFYSLTDELHQYFVPGRHASLGDVFVDGLGIVFALLIYSFSWVQNKSGAD